MGSLLEVRRVEGTNPGKNRKKLAVMGEKVQERACKIWSPLAGCGMAGVLGGSYPSDRHTSISSLSLRR